MSESRFKITWHDAGFEPQCAPDPDYPDGIDLDISGGALVACSTPLGYPAARCGSYVVECQLCGTSCLVTTAGRRNDPRSLKLPCKWMARA